VRLSEFRRLVDEEFAESAGSLLRSHVLAELECLTAQEALDRGIDPRSVWLALCRDLDVPEDRWLGRLPAPAGHTRKTTRRHH